MDSNVYPKTSALEKFINEAVEEHQSQSFTSARKSLQLVALKKLLVETVHDYEHGNAEPGDVFDFKELEGLKTNLGEEWSRDLMMRLYIAVCEDLFQTALYE